MKDQQPSRLQEQNRTIFIVSAKPKSVVMAIALSILFGPAGLLYASIAGGIIMFVFAFLAFFFLPLAGLLLVWIGCIIWAVTAVGRANQQTEAHIINYPKQAERPGNRE